LGFEPPALLDVLDVVDEVSVGAAGGVSALGVLGAGALEADGLGVVVSGVGVAAEVEAELSGTLDVSAGALIAGEGETALEVERLLGVAFTVFGEAFFGAEVVSSTVAVSCAREAGALDDTAEAGGVASATTVDGVVVVVVVVVLVSPAGDATFVSRPDAGPAVATGPALPTSWLKRNAPAITRAMITPKAMGKCFMEASRGIGQSRSDRSHPRGCASAAIIGGWLQAGGHSSDNAVGLLEQGGRSPQ
jgi:hypothetical protein